MDKVIVADSSSIISLAVTCMSTMLEEMDARFVVPGGVYDEIVTHPITSKRYALESLRIKRLFSDGVLSVREPSPGSVSEVLDVSNSIYWIKKQRLSLIHPGEAEALALVRELSADAFLIDERTTRMMIEDPLSLRDVLSQQSRRHVGIDDRRMDSFRSLAGDVSVIRSSEVAAIAYEKGILGRRLGAPGKEALLATLYALKFSGCAISWQEIEDYGRMFP